MPELLGGDAFPLLEKSEVTQIQEMLSELEKLDRVHKDIDEYTGDFYGNYAELARLEMSVCRLHLIELLAIQQLIERTDISQKEKALYATVFWKTWQELDLNPAPESAQSIDESLFDLYYALLSYMRHSYIESAELLEIATEEGKPKYQKGHDFLQILSSALEITDRVMLETFLRDPDPMTQNLIDEAGGDVEDLL